MDKTWISKERDSLDYEIGVEEFLIYAQENSKDPKRIPCPCARCANFKQFSVNIIRGHIYENGFSLGYVNWIWHGENDIGTTRSSVGSTPLPTLVPNFDTNIDVDISETVNVCEAAYKSYDYDNESFEFRRFVADAQQPLFEGSDYTKLESMLKLHNWKARFGISDTAFSDLLSSIGSFLPKDNVMPANSYEAKKIPSNLGLEYIKFHSCPNDCILYRGIYADESECPKCHSLMQRARILQCSNWKAKENS